jgi:hypothetical protein
MSEFTAQQAYVALQRLAREQGRTTQQLFELYVHERFLARLAASPLADRFVLKGGMLLRELSLLAYPIENVVAEKAETMIFRGDANTRDRDFGDVYSLISVHPFNGRVLAATLSEVAAHHDHTLRPLGETLHSLAESRQRPWEAFRERAGLPALPARFADVVAAVVAFVDPLLEEPPPEYWNPTVRRWR